MKVLKGLQTPRTALSLSLSAVLSWLSNAWPGVKPPVARSALKLQHAAGIQLNATAVRAA